MAFKIALDDGHGMKTSGKRTPIFPSTSGLKSETGNFMHENEFNRAVVNYLADHLKRCGFDVIFTAPNNEDPSLAERCKIANDKKADLFLSVHANAFRGIWGKAQGVETYASKRWGTIHEEGAVIHKWLVSSSKLYNRGLKDGDWLYIVKNTAMPSVLIECGFMDNLAEARLLLSDEYRRDIALGMAKAICEIFNVRFVEVKKEEPQPEVKKEAVKNDSIHRVIIDGVQVGAYGENKNILEQVEKAIKEGAKEIKIEKV